MSTSIREKTKNRLLPIVAQFSFYKEKLKDLPSQTSSFFKVLCLTEYWFNDRNSESSLYQFPQYTAIHKHRIPSHKSGQGFTSMTY